MAGNQLGKTVSAGYEIAYHTTGQYPDWWQGRRYPGPNNWWVANTNNETTRENPQRVLLGEDNEWGSGTIPLSAFAKKPTMARGFPDLVDKIQIKHISGSNSSIQFKAYEQGWRKFQGATIRGGIWLDEEPDDHKIYTECMARISAGGGLILLTMTPLLGLSDIVAHFHPEPDEPFRHLTMMEIEDAPHMGDEEERAIIVAGYPAHEREARTKGHPLLGRGKIWTIPQSEIEVPHRKLPADWPALGGVDFGYGHHPFAAAKLVHDRDNDIVYFTNDYKDKSSPDAASAPIHASSVRQWGEQLRYAWPHDGNREWGSSGPIKDVYKREGMRMLNEHATFKSGGYSPNAAIELTLSRMKTKRFKVFDTCNHWWTEFAGYHRDDKDQVGQIVKRNDDVTDAMFKALMMLRFARVDTSDKQFAPLVAGHDDDPFDW